MRRNAKINIAIAVLLLVSVVSAGWGGVYYYSLARASEQLDKLAEEFHHSDGAGEMMPGFQRLYQQNNDLAGWLTIPGTNIDYPVMHTPREPEYYLRRDFTGQYSPNGTPFVDGSCSLQPRSDNVIIHGHNMRNDTMFAQLLLYERQEFWQEHPRLYFYAAGQRQVYDIIGVFRTEVYNDDLPFKYHQFIQAADEDCFNRYIAQAQKASLYPTGLSAQYGDLLLTLSTCAYHTTHGRFVVLARCAQK